MRRSIDPAQEIEELRRRLAEAEQALEAIRSGAVDSLVVEDPNGMRVYALEGEGNTYRVLMETMNEGAATLNEDGLILYCNAHFADLLHCPLERIMGRPMLAFLPEAEHEKLDELVAAARDAPVRGEFCFAGDGVEVPVQLSVNSFEQEGRLVLCLVATDLREQKRNEAIMVSEKTLRAVASRNAFRLSLNDTLRPLVDAERVQAEASRLLGEYLDASRVMYGEVSPDGTELIIERCYVASGVAPLTGRFRMADFSPALIARLARGHTLVLHEVGSDPQLTQDERGAFSRSGIGSLVSVPLAKEGQFVASLNVHQSRPRQWTAEEIALIEETGERTWGALSRARAVEALKLSETKYRDLFNSIDQAFCILEVLFDERGHPYDYRFLEINPAFGTHTGLSNVIGKTVRELVPDHEPGSLEAYARIALTGIPARFENRAEGLGRILDIYAFRVGDPHDHRVAVLFSDIGDRKRAEAALREADERKSEFLAVLSHELRNPLAPVLAAVQLMQRKPDLSEDLRLPLDIIRRNLQLEARLIDDLLDLTRIEQGKLLLYRQPTTVASLVERAVEIAQPDIATRRLHFGLDMQDPGVLVHVDASRIQQVIWNLLSNAVKFTPHDGCIGLRCYRRNENAIIEVSDSGIGIEPDRLERVFDAFEQGDRSITRQFGGLGLGLAIAKRLVALHDGTIHAYSAGRGEGATFRVALPVAPSESQRPVEQRAFPAARKSARILIVEDKGDTAEMTRMLLEQFGYEVEIAGDVAQALKTMESRAFDVLLSDLGLPDGSGIDLMRSLRARGDTTRGIAMSGYGQEEDVRRSREAGFAVHLTKPVDADMLADAISGVLR